MNTLDLMIKTERLSLVSIGLVYRDNIFLEFTEEITVYMFPQPSDKIAGIDKFINSSLKGMEEGSNIQQVIINSKTGEFLGCAGLHKINTKTPEFGIWIKLGAHGNKYGLEAMSGLKDWADKHLDYEYIKYPVAVANIPSRKIAESLGGKIEREYVGKKQNGELMDEVEYRIYK